MTAAKEVGATDEEANHHIPSSSKHDNNEDEDAEPDVSTSPPPSFTKLLSLAQPEYSMLFVGFILMVLAEGSALYNPLLLADAYDSLVNPELTQEQRISDINTTMVIVLVVHGLGVLSGFLRSAIMNAAGERVVARLRNRLYASILKQEIAFFDEHKTGELVSRLGSDTTLVQMATSVAISEVILGGLKLVVSVALMFWISPALAGVTMGTVSIIFLVCVPFGSLLGKLSKSYQDILGQAQVRSTEALGGMRTVQSFAAEERECRRYGEKIGYPDDFPYWWPVGGGKGNETETDDRHSSSSNNNNNNNNNNSRRRSHDHKKTTYSVGFFKAIANTGFFTFIFGFGFGAMYVSLWYGFKLVNDGDISLGDLTAFQSYIFQIGSALGQTSRYLSQVIEARGASGRIFDLLERVPAIPSPFYKQKTLTTTTIGDSTKDSSNIINNNNNDNSGGGNTEERKNGVNSMSHSSGRGAPTTTAAAPSSSSAAAPLIIQPSSMVGRVEFRNVSFSYPSRSDVPVLVNFSLTIPANTTAAIVGPSGAGKSTVVSLLQRFYDINDNNDNDNNDNNGQITIDGHDIRALNLKWMRRQIGYVQQEPQLFGLTVRENVCYGLDRPVTEEEIQAACMEANAHDFIMSWPKQYDTLVGERGVKLSGGQKQRVSIARALLIDPKILLLDEATSALDAESEHLVQEAIDKAVIGRTVLIVAHRLSTIKRADKIVVLDDATHRIEDVGTHDVLLKRCRKYQDLIKRQSVVAPVASNS